MRFEGMRHSHVQVLSWLLQMQTGLDRCVHGRMRASNRFRDGRATITRLAGQKETEHRGICVRNFSCNPINGGSHRGRASGPQEPLPLYGSLASGRAAPPRLSVHERATLRALLARPIAQMRRLDSTDERAPEMYFTAEVVRHSRENPVGSTFQNRGWRWPRCCFAKKDFLSIVSRLIGHAARFIGTIRCGPWVEDDSWN